MAEIVCAALIPLVFSVILNLLSDFTKRRDCVELSEGLRFCALICVLASGFIVCVGGLLTLAGTIAGDCSA